MTSTVFGVDGSRDGWLTVELTPERTLIADVCPDIGTLLRNRPDARVVAIDIPIGAPAPSEYPRAADHLARAMIGRLRSSVFSVPPRDALAAATYLEANDVCREHGLPGISQQTWAIARKILEVEPYAVDLRVYEIHPEVSFAAMHGKPLVHGKRSWDGFYERRAILRRASIDPDSVVGSFGRATVDDVLDAIAGAWSARRIADGTAGSLPPQADGRSPAIWY